MAEYESTIHLPRWRRAAIWLAQKTMTNPLFGIGLGLILFGPILIFGWWWAAVLAAFVIGCVYGYSIARSEWIHNGDVPKL